jgi:undecaprenyl-diphosphatase
VNKTNEKPNPAEREIAHRLKVRLLILLGAAWLFGIVVENVVNHASMTRIDDRVAAYLYALATPLFTIILTSISFFGAPAVTGSIAAVTGIVLWRRRHTYRLLLLGIAVPGGMLFNVLIKYVIHRPRPFFDHPLLTLSGYSFPSGHAMASTVLYGILATFAVRTSCNWQRRALAVLTAAALIAVVCFSRIYLGVHYLSDVLAGILEGVVWLALCLTAVDVLEERRAPR